MIIIIMSNLFTIIDQFRTEQCLISLERELDITTKKKRIAKLNKLISEIKPIDDKYDAKKALHEIYETYDKNKFKQPWKKLTRDQKIEKIKEYDNDYDSDEINNILENKKIKYNPSEELIEKIC